jgi:hypothetical protein
VFVINEKESYSDVASGRQIRYSIVADWRQLKKTAGIVKQQISPGAQEQSKLDIGTQRRKVKVGP